MCVCVCVFVIVIIVFVIISLCFYMHTITPTHHTPHTHTHTHTLHTHYTHTTHTQKRYQILDSSAQRQKAYLAYSQGNRRLPSHIASLVGDEYYEKRKSYDPKLLIQTQTEVSGRSRSRTNEEPIQTPPTIVTAQEREKQVHV